MRNIFVCIFVLFLVSIISAQAQWGSISAKRTDAEIISIVSTGELTQVPNVNGTNLSLEGVSHGVGGGSVTNVGLIMLIMSDGSLLTSDGTNIFYISADLSVTNNLTSGGGTTNTLDEVLGAGNNSTKSMSVANITNTDLVASGQVTATNYIGLWKGRDTNFPDVAIATHAALPSEHHTKYSDEETTNAVVTLGPLRLQNRPNVLGTNLALVGELTFTNTLDEVLAQGNNSSRAISVGNVSNANLVSSGKILSSVGRVNVDDTLFSTNGNVGIGTNRPIAVLHVNGGIRIEEDFDAGGRSFTNVGSVMVVLSDGSSITADGTNIFYISADLSTTNNLINPTIGTNGKFVVTFTDADINGSGNLIVTHNLGVTQVVIYVVDDLGGTIIPDNRTWSNDTIAVVNLSSFTPFVGTGTVVVLSAGGFSVPGEGLPSTNIVIVVDRNGVDQLITNATTTVIDFTRAIRNDGGAFDLALSLLNVPVNGSWRLELFPNLDVDNGISYVSIIETNEVTAARGRSLPGSAGVVSAYVVAVLNLTTNDKVRFLVNHGSAGNKNLRGSGSELRAIMTLVNEE